MPGILTINVGLNYIFHAMNYFSNTITTECKWMGKCVIKGNPKLGVHEIKFAGEPNPDKKVMIATH